MKTLTLAALAALLPVAALAHDGMHINDAYARSTNPKTAAVFLQLANHRAVDCTLQSVSTKAAERAELHTHVETDGVMRMTHLVDGITVRAGEMHELVRGGDHVMLLGLTRPLEQGDSLTMTFDFGDCGTEEAEAVVDNDRAEAAAPTGSAHGTHAGH